MATAAQNDRKDQSSQARTRFCSERGCKHWVSTDLEVYQPNDPDCQPEDISLDGKAYRRLSPEYYLWLQARFEKFQIAIGKTNADRADANVLEFIRRFETLRAIAQAHYTLPDLKAAKKRLNSVPFSSPNQVVRQAQIPKTTPANTHKPVRPAKPSFLFPQDDHAVFDPEAMRFTAPVTSHSLEQVNAIRDEALAAGWTELELYQNRGRYRFPFGGDYGVACHINPGQKLGAVTQHAIELICRGGHSLYFRRRGREHLPIPKPQTNQEVAKP